MMKNIEFFVNVRHNLFTVHKINKKNIIEVIIFVLVKNMFRIASDLLNFN